MAESQLLDRPEDDSNRTLPESDRTPRCLRVNIDPLSPHLDPNPRVHNQVHLATGTIAVWAIPRTVGHDDGILYPKNQQVGLSAKEQLDLYTDATKTRQTKYQLLPLSLSDTKKLDNTYNLEMAVLHIKTLKFSAPKTMNRIDQLLTVSFISMMLCPSVGARRPQTTQSQNHLLPTNLSQATLHAPLMLPVMYCPAIT